MKIILLLTSAFILFISSINAQNYERSTSLNHLEDTTHFMTISDSEEWLAAGGKNGKICIWKTTSFYPAWKGHLHQQAITDMAFGMNDRLLATCSRDGIIALWDVSTGNLFYSHPIEGESLSFVLFSKKQGCVYTGGKKGKLYRINFPGVQQPFNCLNIASSNDLFKNITSATILNQDTLVVTNGYYIKKVHLPTHRITENLLYPYETLNDINTLLPNKLVTWSYDGKISLWDEQHSLSYQYQTGYIKQYFHPFIPKKRSWILIPGHRGKLTILDQNTFREEFSIVTKFPQITATVMMEEKNNAIIIAGTNGLIDIWTKKPDEVKPKKDPLATPTTIVNIPYEQGEPIIDPIHFIKGKTEIPEAEYHKLEIVFKTLLQYPEIGIEISGHTDNIGNPLLNHQLSKERANLVKSMLLEKGIPAQRIQIIAYGGKKPLADNTLEENRKMNRRVEIRALFKAK